MVYPTTRKMFQYTFAGLVICQAMRCGCTMARKSMRMVWVHHGEEEHENEPVAEDAVTYDDRMDEMLNAICPKFESNFEDPLLWRFKSFLSSLTSVGYGRQGLTEGMAQRGRGGVRWR
jgi:hypothetical protein